MKTDWRNYINLKIRNIKEKHITNNKKQDKIKEIKNKYINKKLEFKINLIKNNNIK